MTMDPQLAIDAGRDAIRTCLMVGGPILLVTLVVGLLISVLQAMTQLHDQSLSFVPKILLLMVAIGICLPWLSDRMLDFARVSFAKPEIIEFVGTASAEAALSAPTTPDTSDPTTFERVASRPQWIDDAESPAVTSAVPAKPLQDEDKGEPGTVPAPQDKEPPQDVAPTKSPFILPSYRYQPKERADLEG